jgi:hypothetical protein
MKVFYIGKFFHSWNTENYVAHALKQNVAEVVKRVYTSTGQASSYINQIKKHKPDFVLFSKASSRCFKELIEWCKENNVLTVCWLWDLYWGYRPQRPPQFMCDLLFSTDGGHPMSWEDYGANHQVLRQGIHEPDHRLFENSKSVDIAFVGSTNSYKQRRILTRWLTSTYGDRISFHSNLRGLDLNKELAKTKIVVGDTYPVKNYWSNRVYEILGRGGFLLFPETVGLDSEFTDKVHYVSYPRGNFRALRDRISYYLAHDEEREKIRQAGFEKCGEYTYTSRVKELLTRIAAYKATGSVVIPLAPKATALDCAVASTGARVG